MADVDNMYESREVELVERARAELGDERVLRGGLDLEWRDGEPVLKDDATGHTLSLGQDGRLWCRMVRSGTVLHGVIENGGVVHLGHGHATEPYNN